MPVSFIMKVHMYTVFIENEITVKKVNFRSGNIHANLSNYDTDIK